MAVNKGIRKFTVQESVAPYTRAFNPDAGQEYPVCRAIVNTHTGTQAATVTFADGSTLSLTLEVGQIAPLAVIKTDTSNVDFLY